MQKGNYLLIAIVIVFSTVLFLLKENNVPQDDNNIKNLAIKLDGIEKKVEEIKISISRLESNQTANINTGNFRRDNLPKQIPDERAINSPHNSLNLARVPHSVFPKSAEGNGAVPPPIAWINTLSPEKKSAVTEVFRQSSDNLRKKFSEISAEERSDITVVSALVEDNNEDIKRKMSTILTGEEYDLFINSLPAAPFSNRNK